MRLDHPLAQVTKVNAAAWGDYDNDGLVDVYFCRDGANQLWRQDVAGDAAGSGWIDVTAETGTANGRWDCADTLMIDADHDGDLDLFVVNRDGPNELYSNNLDGTFPAAGRRSRDCRSRRIDRRHRRAIWITTAISI